MYHLKPQNQFPLLKKYQEKFKTDKNTIFAYGDTIYVNGTLTPDLLVHELTHLEQQERDGLDYWTKNYLNNPEYRLKQELEAYKKQLESIKDRNLKAKVTLKSALTLSSPLYGNLLTFEQAKQILK